MFLVHLLILVGNRVNPVTYLKKAFPVLSFAFVSRTSAGALPMNIETQSKALGVDPATANFAASFGMSIGQNGCAGIYPAMMATLIAPTVGINVFDPTWIIGLIAVIVISSFGVAGVGGGATFASLIVLGTMGLPIEIVGLMASVEPLIDMGRTALNVSDSMVAGVTSSNFTGGLAICTTIPPRSSTPTVSRRPRPCSFVLCVKSLETAAPMGGRFRFRVR